MLRVINKLFLITSDGLSIDLSTCEIAARLKILEGLNFLIIFLIYLNSLDQIDNYNNFMPYIRFKFFLS